MLHGGGLKKAIPARTIETHSPPGIEKTLNNMLREKAERKKVKATYYLKKSSFFYKVSFLL